MTKLIPFAAAAIQKSLRTIVPSLALSAGITMAATASPETKPNIVLVLADDLGYGSVSCYGADTNLVRTPNIDRLATQGRRFTDATASSSVCSPSRYSILTGRYCWRTSLKFEVLGNQAPLHIETNRLTLASLLKSKGYQTAAIGKWHLGFGATRPNDLTKTLRPGPLDIGFDYFYGLPANHADPTGIYVDTETEADGLKTTKIEGLRSPVLKPFGSNYYTGKPYLGIDAPQRVDTEVMPHFTDKAVEWLGQQTTNQPFFLYFAPVAVHEPATPSAKTRGTSAAGNYGDWIHELDLSVGKILAALDANGFGSNTLVIFTSDNGGENHFGMHAWLDFEAEANLKAIAAGLKMNGPWREGKHSIYEGGLREPFIARWPGKIPAHSVSDEPISLVDTLATTAAIVGYSLPARTAGAEDSFNVLPALLGENHAAPVRPFLVEHSADGVFAVRQGDWKWIEGVCAKPNEPKARENEFHAQLYNLKADPTESHDVIGEHPQIAAQLAALLETFRKQGYSRN